MPNTILKILGDLYFNPKNQVPCGPDHKYLAHFPGVHHKTYVAGDLKGSFPFIVPDNMYHPEIYFAIDFLHQFTVSDTASDGEKIKGERPVPAETLQKVTVELIKFFYYYFMHGVDPSKSQKLRDAINSINVGKNEENDSLFVNNVLNFFAMGFGIERSIGQVGTATISLKDMDSIDVRGQGHGFRLFYDKTMGILNQILAPMLPVGIWARGRFYKDWFFPQFDGYITNVTYSINQGFPDATITCRDQLELARISHEMVNPAIIQPGEIRKKPAINIFEMPFYKIDHFQIVGGMFTGGNIKFDPKGNRILDIDITQTNSIETQSKKSDGISFQGLGNFSIAIDSDTNQDSQKMGAKLKDVVQREAVHEDDISGNYIRYFLDQLSKRSKNGRYIVGWGTKITPYRVWGTRGVEPFRSQFDNRLSIIQKVSELSYYNIYADRSGNIQYHPMRLSNRYLSDICLLVRSISDKEYVPNPFPGVQIFSDEERFSGTANLNIEELVTFMHLKGINPFVPEETLTSLAYVGSATDKEYLAKYGYRRQEASNALFNYNMEITDRNTGKKFKFLDAAAYALLKFKNAELYTRQDSIVYRPEMDIAQPVYVPETDEVFYAQSLSISVNIGADASTGVNMNLGRKFNDPPVDLMSFLEDSEAFYKIYNSKEGTNEAIVPNYTYKKKLETMAAEQKAADAERARKAAQASSEDNQAGGAGEWSDDNPTEQDISKGNKQRSKQLADEKRKGN